MDGNSMTRGCLDFAANLLCEIPSVFGRLVYVAGRRNATSGRYEDAIMGGIFGEDAVHDAFDELHAETFSSWMEFSQSQQRKDLAWHMHAAKISPGRLVDIWINSQLSASLVPAGARDREPFIRKLAVLLILISAESPE
jgi:hypothetical protein